VTLGLIASATVCLVVSLIFKQLKAIALQLISRASRNQSYFYLVPPPILLPGKPSLGLAGGFLGLLVGRGLGSLL
jgi:hypothetical protein